MNFSSIDDFYEKLIADYDQKHGADKDRELAKRQNNEEGSKLAAADKGVRQCFLYRYFERKKNVEALRAAQNKTLLFSVKDEYVFAKGAHIAFENGIITKQEYREIFRAVNKDKSGEKKRALLFDTEPDKALGQLEHLFLMGTIDDFIKNAKKRKSNPAKGKKYVDTIEMLREFYEYESEPETYAGKASSELSDDYILKCARLYEIIRGEDAEFDNWRYVTVPLYVDKDSGAGVYILGGGYFGSDDIKVGVLSFDHVQAMESDRIVAEDPVLMDMAKPKSINNKNPDRIDKAKPQFINVSMKYTEYNSVEQAFAEFKAGVIKGAYLKEYSENNDDIFPNGVDECFKSRFINLDDITVQDNRAEAAVIETIKGAKKRKAP